MDGLEAEVGNLPLEGRPLQVLLIAGSARRLDDCPGMDGKARFPMHRMLGRARRPIDDLAAPSPQTGSAVASFVEPGDERSCEDILTACCSGRRCCSSRGRKGRMCAATAALTLGGGLQYVLAGLPRLDDRFRRLAFAPLQPGSGMAMAEVACVPGTAAGLLPQDAGNRRVHHANTISA